MNTPTDIPGLLDGSERNARLMHGLSRAFIPLLDRYFAAEVTGLENIPEDAALMVGNHSGGMSTPDSFILCGHILRERGLDHVPFGLAHDKVVQTPIVGPLMRSIGAVRGSHEAADALFRQGRKVIVYPGGDVESYRPSRDRHRIDFAGRTGYTRVALRHGVPIVPIVAAGAHSGFLVVGDLTPLARLLGITDALHVRRWPTTVSIPWGWLPAPCPPYLPLPTRILIEVMPPVPPPQSESECAEFDATLRASMQETLDRLVARRRKLGSFSISSRKRGPTE